MSAAAPELLSQRSGLRIAALVTAAPVACCAAGLAVLLLLKHQQAAFAAGYAARHMTPWPGPTGWMGEPSSFLHAAEPLREVLARNPAQWAMDIGMAAFALTPAIVVAGAVAVYGAARRRRAALLGGLLPIAALAWFSAAPLHMMLSGREVVLDAGRNALTLNGRQVATLSEVAGFEGLTDRRRRGEVSHRLVARLRSGRGIELGGPDDRPDLVDAARPLDAALARLRPPAPSLPP